MNLSIFGALFIALIIFPISLYVLAFKPFFEVLHEDEEDVKQ